MAYWTIRNSNDVAKWGLLAPVSFKDLFTVNKAKYLPGQKPDVGQARRRLSKGKQVTKAGLDFWLDPDR